MEKKPRCVRQGARIYRQRGTAFHLRVLSSAL